MQATDAGVDDGDNSTTEYQKDIRELEKAPEEAKSLSDDEKAWHTLFSLVVMNLVHHYWNGNKDGETGWYPQRTCQMLCGANHAPYVSSGAPGVYVYEGGTYLGHNIAAIAVNSDKEILDFDFNHNYVHQRTIEHAEARLIRRLFSVGLLYPGGSRKGIPEGDEKTRTPPYGLKMSDITVYTSLESCSQCSGLMSLAGVGKVVYVQHDPGQSFIGNILYNLYKPPRQSRPSGRGGAAPAANTGYPTPLPISGDQIGLGYYGELNAGYAKFQEDLKKEHGAYFWLPSEPRGPEPATPAGTTTPQPPPSPGHDVPRLPDNSPDITSYLCTDHARDIYRDAAKRLDQYLTSKIPLPAGGPKDMLDRLNNFLQYACNNNRGTGHF